MIVETEMNKMVVSTEEEVGATTSASEFRPEVNKMVINTEKNFSLTIAVGDCSNSSRPDSGNGGDDCISSMKVDDSLNEIDFEFAEHLPALLSALNHMRNKGQLTDVTLKTENQTFQAHRVVLSACSDYFRAMFTEPMRERGQTDILLAGVSASGVKLLLDYVYTSKLALSLANIQDVLSAASHLQVLKVVEACSNYLHAQLDVDNCVDVVTIAETYALDALRKRVYRFMSENLSVFSRQPDFYSALSAAQMEHLLDSDFPVDVPEERLLEILLGWLNEGDRQAHAHRLVRKVNFGEIHVASLEHLLERKRATAKNLPKTFLAKVRTLGSQSLGKSLPAANNFINSRGLEEALVKVGGFSTHGVTNQINYRLPSDAAGKWRLLAAVPHIECCNFGTAVLRNELYILGGCFNQAQQENIHPFGFKYNPQLDKWTRILPMQMERCRFSVTVFGDALFAFGGVAESGPIGAMELQQEVVCEKYVVDDDVWLPLAPFPPGFSSRSQHASARLGNVILISGGLDHDLVLSSILVYHPDNDLWESSLRSMPTPRADHAMLPRRERILFVGGWHENEAGLRQLVAAVDSYDPASDSWEEVTRVPTPRFHAASALVQDKLYVMGGFLRDQSFDRGTNLIECYDFTSGAWSVEKSYPLEVWEHSCASLYIPRCREDMEIMPRASSGEDYWSKP